MRRLTAMSLSATLLSLTACSQMPPLSGKSAALKDGELALPGDYKTWPKFLHGVQRADAKQVRDIYINPKGHAASPADLPLRHDLRHGELQGQGEPGQHPRSGADGKLVKGDIAAIFVMGKGEGWGKVADEKLATGEWAFAAYKPDGSKSDADLNGCRGCHAPLKDKDFVARADEYFAARGR